MCELGRKDNVVRDISIGLFAIEHFVFLAVMHGFVMMPNEIETYREGQNAFEFKGTNGFLLTFDMTSKDIPTNKPSMSY